MDFLMLVGIRLFINNRAWSLMPITRASRKKISRALKKMEYEKIKRAHGLLRHKRLNGVRAQRVARDEWK